MEGGVPRYVARYDNCTDYPFIQLSRSMGTMGARLVTTVGYVRHSTIIIRNTRLLIWTRSLASNSAGPDLISLIVDIIACIPYSRRSVIKHTIIIRS